MILLDPGLGVSSFKGERWGSMTKASLIDVNGLGGHGRDLDLALYFTGGPRRLQEFAPWRLEMVERF